MNDISDILIPLIFIIVVVIIISVVFYLLALSSFNTVKNGLSIQCAPGQCATNLQSGFKRCPTGNTDAIIAEASIEVCNSQFACDNPLTPFALQSDGSTNMFGVCSTTGDVACPCLKQAQCSEYILGLFNTNGGNPYATNNNPNNVSAFGGQRISFPQTTTTLNGSIVTDQTPISYNNPGSNFCSIPASWLPFAGCGFITSNQITEEDIILCMNGGPPPGGNFSACNQGVLAFVTNDSSNIDINSLQLSCVRGEQCPVGKMNIYDTNLNQIVCR